jgi:putative ABC transport system substrate-binding protein
MTAEIGAKRLGVLQELLPGAARFAVLVNPTNQLTEPIIANIREAAAAIHRSIDILAASTNMEIDTAFATAAQKGVQGLLVSPDPFFDNRRVQIITLAVRHVLPAIFPFREYVPAGGLMSYGPSFPDIARLAGVYTGRILKGEKPADLPVLQATKFELTINLQTAKLLGLTVPVSLLARADEVIE